MTSTKDDSNHNKADPPSLELDKNSENSKGKFRDQFLELGKSHYPAMAMSMIHFSIPLISKNKVGYPSFLYNAGFGIMFAGAR
ncbi:hypothetical protein BB558_000090 [Smittium angustum]|uniref:Uncharacterized protein n=1 Tax=Smittium angustum TaxID=133377 RepID=A0A2U1JF48_SMIAN|nr:hypothetical protein BB558_000090 [Smittium angustum]